MSNFYFYEFGTIQNRIREMHNITDASVTGEVISGQPKLCNLTSFSELVERVDTLFI